jgi:hypothetical protein
MVDELRPVAKSWFIDRIRFGEKYLRYNLDDIVTGDHFSNLRDIKTMLDQKKSEEDTRDSPYDNLTVPKEKLHDIDELI